MKRMMLKVAVAVGIVGLLACGTAYALKIQIGPMVVSASSEILPRDLPAHRDAPVTIESTTRIGTGDGSKPSTLRELIFMFDKNGSIDTKGLPTCTLAKLAGTTPEVARKRCAGAIVGEGVGRAKVTFPGQAPTEISSPLTLFNAPAEGGKPTIIAHAYEKVPTPQAVLAQFAIERIKHGRYGYQAKIVLPEIAGGYGAATLAKATIGRTWSRGGKTVGYVNAHCEGGRLQVHGALSFTDGSFFPGTLVSPCNPRG